MSNNKQTHLEWLIEQLKEYDFSNEDDTYLIKIPSWVLTEKHEQAMVMHKEEQEQLSARWAKLREQTRETAMHIGFARGFECGLECYEDYYEALYDTNLDEDDFTRNYIVDRFEETYIKDNESNNSGK